MSDIKRLKKLVAKAGRAFWELQQFASELEVADLSRKSDAPPVTSRAGQSRTSERDKATTRRRMRQ